MNGEHFCSFSYRVPLEDVTAFEVNGTIEDLRTRQLNLFVYPDPNIYRPSRTLVLTEGEPLVDFLVRSASPTREAGGERRSIKREIRKE